MAVQPIPPSSRQNDIADAGSRLEAEAEHRRGMPRLGEAVFVAPPPQGASLWKARLDFSQEAPKPAKHRFLGGQIKPAKASKQPYNRGGRGVLGEWPL